MSRNPGFFREYIDQGKCNSKWILDRQPSFGKFSNSLSAATGSCACFITTSSNSSVNLPELGVNPKGYD
jgi:hypothetical protein